MTTQANPTDLNWSLKAFEQPSRAVEFFDQFNGAFAIYSSTVEKLYTDYVSTMVSSAQPVLMIQPDFYQFTSMFHNIDRDSIKKSSVLIYEAKGALKLSGVMNDTNTRHSFALKEGLHRLFDGQFIEGAFLPVLTYGDLRTLPGQTMPVLQLHKLNTARLKGMSEFQMQDMIGAMQQNLIQRLN